MFFSISDNFLIVNSFLEKMTVFLGGNIMESILYQRIKSLCEEKRISISKLEAELGFGNSSIKKWSNTSSPSVDKIIKVASYFNVSVDYILGRTDIKGSISEVIGDEDIISFQRARQKMTKRDKERMMQMLKLGFEHAFSDQDGDDK